MTNPRNVRPAAQSALERGLAAHRQNQLGLAQSHYSQAVKLDPSNADAWNLLGLAAHQLGLHAKAVKHLRQAIALQPDFAAAWNHLGIALKALTQFEAAHAAFDKALEIRPNYVEARHNLGVFFESQNAVPAAIAAYRQCLAVRPEAFDSASNLGLLLRKQGELAQAKALLTRVDRALNSADSALNLALVLLDLGDSAAAVTAAERALAFAPGALDAMAALATALRLENNLSRALPLLRHVATAAPNSSEALYELALAENASGDWTGAKQLLARAQRLAPHNEALRWCEALLLPTLVRDQVQLDSALAGFEAALADFNDRSFAATSSEALLNAVLATSSFDLAYLAAAPTRILALQQRFGALISRVVREALAPQLLSTVHAHRDAALAAQHYPAKTPGIVRVGILSSYLRTHTVMRFFGGLLEALCQHPAFEVFVFYTGATIDAGTESLRTHAAHFEHAQWPALKTVGSALAANLDVMLYPDVGMDAQQQFYAAWRLAPVQAALYGHPISTGLAAVDVFFSGSALEPGESGTGIPLTQSHAHPHYTEALHRLAGLGTALRKPSMPEHSAAEPAPGGPARLAARLLCTQNLSKLTLDFDATLAAILCASNAQLVLFDRQSELSARYLTRLFSAIARHTGEDRAAYVNATERVVLRPMLNYQAFLAELAQADLVLDSPWFSGGATSVDAFGVGTPVLTQRAPFARGRQTMAMLELMQLPELIASDSAHYVTQATQLLAQPAMLQRLRQDILARNAVLFASAEGEFCAAVLALGRAVRA
jgi:protein O-GlcNAc transferase